MVCLEPETGLDGGPGLVGTVQFHGKLRWRLGLSVSVCKMNGLNRNSVSHRSASGDSRRQKGALCVRLLSAAFR